LIGVILADKSTEAVTTAATALEAEVAGATAS